MRGDEVRIVNAFARHLEIDGWSVEREVDFVDLVATLWSDALHRSQGRTAAKGLDIDTLYG